MKRIAYGSPKVCLLITLLVIGSLYEAGSAQQQGTPVTANFTGGVRRMDASNLATVRFQYDAGARSYWHVHDGLQVLMIEQGRGRMQLQGQPVQDMVAGQPVALPAGVPHWHGAAPDQGLTWISVSTGTVKWMQAVTDAEYQAPPKR